MEDYKTIRGVAKIIFELRKNTRYANTSPEHLVLRLDEISWEIMEKEEREMLIRYKNLINKMSNDSKKNKGFDPSEVIELGKLIKWVNREGINISIIP